ncbi:MAG: hypothetical protein ACOC5T_10235, partial [Elusimicrobiota bacterium]
MSYQIFKKIYHDMGSNEYESLMCSMLPLGNLSYELDKYPDKVINDIKKYPIQSDIIYYPCYIIELRNILNTQSLFSNHDVSLFSLGFIQRYCSDFPLWIGIDCSSMLLSNFGGVALISENPLSLRGIIKKVYVNNYLTSKQVNTVNNIIDGSANVLDIDMMESVNGLKTPVIADNKFNFKKYAIQIDIDLTENERRIFQFLVKARNSVPVAKNVKMRVAGGWVRDKILKKESDDIDIAISQMSGIEFANLISQYAKTRNIKEVGNAYEVSLEKTKDNDDKKDQLLVGGIKILGYKIEFVSMRTETYTKESRTPEISRTDNPEEDALRRDLTINALYYNIDTGRIEDYVGGFSDLKNMILKTPLSPEQTFKDDPLRMLRILRFYSKFSDSKLDPKLEQALYNPEVQKLYDVKVTPERASKEFFKIMQSSAPTKAIEVLFQSGLYNEVLELPEQYNDINMDQQNKNHIYKLGSHIIEVLRNINELAKDYGLDEKERACLNLSAFFHDMGKMRP